MSSVTATVVRGSVTVQYPLIAAGRVVPLGGVSVRQTDVPARYLVRMVAPPAVQFTATPLPYRVRLSDDTAAPFRVVLQEPTSVEVRVEGQLWFNKAYHSGLLVLISGGY